MPQSLMAFLAMLIASLAAFNQMNSRIGSFDNVIRSEYELMANAVVLEQMEILDLGTDYENLEDWDGNELDRSFTVGDFNLSFTLTVEVQFVDEDGQPSETETDQKEVIIVATVDGLGQQGINSFTDGSDSGIAAAALLEVMNRMSEVQDTWSPYGPSVMISFLSGSEGDCRGPEAAFRNVTWDKSRLLRVIALQDSAQNSCDWHEMAKKEGIESRVQVLTAPVVQLPMDNTMPFYPYVRRDKWIRLAGAQRLANEAAGFADVVFNVFLEK